jgi:serine/threonine protein kinase
MCDIYSIGAIIFKLLTGQAPSSKISKDISEKRLHANTPSQNVFNVPIFFKDFILSNDMIYIILRLLHQNPVSRFKDLAEVRN